MEAKNAAANATTGSSGLGYSVSGIPGIGNNWGAGIGAEVYRKNNFGVGLGAGLKGSRGHITGPQVGFGFSWKF